MKEAILLAAGYGSRLKPITDKIPKCLVDIHGVPLLGVWLEQLSKVGVTKFYINTHYLSAQVEEFVRQSKFSAMVELFYEEELLGTAGTLKHILPNVKSSDLLVVHADNYCECHWPSFFASHNRASDIFMSMMLFESDNPQSCGIVVLDSENKIIQFHEKVALPPSNLANAAIYILNKPLLITFCENRSTTTKLFLLS